MTKKSKTFDSSFGRPTPPRHISLCVYMCWPFKTIMYVVHLDPKVPQHTVLDARHLTCLNTDVNRSRGKHQRLSELESGEPKR